MTPDQYCQQRAARSGSSFYYSFLFLPPEQKRAIMALYAFCREVDDVVDEVSDPGVARLKLEWWRRELERVFAGAPEHPVGRALAPVVARYRLPREHLEEVIDGMEMDLDQHGYRTWSELELYCYRVAGVVGLMAAEVFGYRDRRTLKYAHHLGLAFQLTNILRDVREDARRGRVYLPREALEAHGVDPAGFATGHGGPGTPALFAAVAERAGDHYDRAFALLPEEDRHSQRSGVIMAAIYRATLEAMAEDGFPVLTQRISLTPLRKLWIAWTTARRENRRQRRLRRLAGAAREDS